MYVCMIQRRGTIVAEHIGCVAKEGRQRHGGSPHSYHDGSNFTLPMEALRILIQVGQDAVGHEA